MASDKPTTESSESAPDRAGVTRELEALRGELEAEKLKNEAALIEQDHRWFRVFYNLWATRQSVQKDDLRRAAAVRALIWRLFSPGTAAAVGITILSVVGLVTAIYANYLLSEQNRRLDQQTYLNEAQRAAATGVELGRYSCRWSWNVLQR